MKSCPECKATYPDDYAICPKDGAPLHESTLWQIGTVVKGKYRIQARLGEGGMAVVYKAHHELLDELRALKVIRPDLARDSEFMGRFRNEAIMARKLNHPNAVRVDDLDIAEDGLPFIAMELVVGDTLKTLIERVGALPVTLVLDITLHVCEALDAAHKLGLIHRDIKPDNIVLIAQREGPPLAKILDFGISRLRQEAASGAKGLTQTGMVIGTPEYMSPEQVMGKKGTDIDGRSDLYSLGIVMYRMLTGELPFTGETTVEMFLQHLHTPAQSPHQIKPELAIPESVSAIVMKAMDKDRDKRFATGAEMAAAIKKARGSTTVSTRKIDWESLSTAEASFGAEKNIPVPPPGRASLPPQRIAPSPATGPVGPSVDRTAYRAPTRGGPPTHQFPPGKLLRLALVIILMGGTLAGWKYYQSWRATKNNSPIPSAMPAEPSPAPVISSPGGQTSEPPKAVSSSPAPDGQHSGSHTELTDAEKEKIKELNNTGAIYYREGGCDKALHPFQEVLDIDPKNPTAYAIVRNCMMKARNAGNGPRTEPPLPIATPPQDSSPPPND